VVPAAEVAGKGDGRNRVPLKKRKAGQFGDARTAFFHAAQIFSITSPALVKIQPGQRKKSVMSPSMTPSATSGEISATKIPVRQ
jgi:hypothetical protein